MRKTKVRKKLADAAGGLESAKENYHTPQSYRNNPVRSNLFCQRRYIRTQATALTTNDAGKPQKGAIILCQFRKLRLNLSQ